MYPVHRHTGEVVDGTRNVPAEFDEEARESFLAIAVRSRTEAVNCYTLMSLGLQSHVAHTRANTTTI